MHDTIHKADDRKCRRDEIERKRTKEEEKKERKRNIETCTCRVIREIAKQVKAILHLKDGFSS